MLMLGARRPRDGFATYHNEQIIRFPKMRECFEWLVEHEKLVVAITFTLVIALVVQVRFCKPRVEPEANLILSPQEAGRTAANSSPTIGISGRWEMNIQKRKGGTQTWTLMLEQNGE